MIVKQPFDFKGQIDRGNGWEQYNGVVRRGWKIKPTKRLSKDLMAKRLVYQTKENKRAYIVHRGGSWFDVNYGNKSFTVQGKDKAEAKRDELNNS